MMAAVFLGYLSGFFGVLFRPFGSLSILAGLLCVAGAFGTANNKRVGYIALGVGAAIVATLFFLAFVFGTINARGILNSTERGLALAASMVFPIALLAAVLHAHTRTYMQAWFE